MRVSFFTRWLFASSLVLVLLSISLADPPSPELNKIFPRLSGSFQSQGHRPLSSLEKYVGSYKPGILAAECAYVSPSGEKFLAEMIRMPSDSEAYALLTKVVHQGKQAASSQFMRTEGVGTASVSSPEYLAFFKGTTFINIIGPSKKERTELASSLIEKLDAGTGDIPVLVKHLPEWETAQQRALYSVSLPVLQMFAPNKPALEAVSFEGGTEAVTASYPSGQLVIVEFATPQLAADNDARINEKINQLRGAGQPTPSAYKRTGNYSVFVFDAPDDGAAKSLIGQVKYEKDVRWLGDNPYAAERANRRWLNMSVGVIVNTLKVSGLAVILCLGVGAAFGGAIFIRRRAQAATQTSFSDAGGMVRLNLDDLAAESSPARLLKHGGK